MLQQILIASYGGAASGQQYWNPADCNALITLSGAGNRIANRAGGSPNTWVSVRAVDSRSTGKKYLEMVNDADQLNPRMMGGLGTAAMSLSNFPGAGTTSWGYHCDASGSETYTNGVATNSGGTNVPAGNYMRIAVDHDAGKLWLGSQTTWEGGGDPATGTTPTYTFTPNLVLYPALGQFSSVQTCTLRLVAADMVGTLPSGFSAWS